MKIMIMGDAKKCAGLMSGGLSEKLDNIMNEGYEIIVGDGLWEHNDVIHRYLATSGYKNVTVYVSGGKRAKKMNAGHWKEKYYAVNGKTMSSKKLERVFGMADDADSGLVIMGDDDFNADLINWVAVLALVSLGKDCLLYPSGKKNPVKLTCIEDLEPYAGEQKDLSEDVIEHILSECGASENLRELLKSKTNFSFNDIVEIIAPAPISLDAKLGLFRDINVRENAKYDLYNTVKKDLKSGKRHKTIKKDLRDTIEFRTEYLFNIWNAYHFIWEAKEALTNGNAFGDIDTVFYLFAYSYDLDTFVEEKFPIGVFTTIEQITAYINSKKHFRTEMPHYMIELWRVNSSGRMTHRFDYYTIKDNICWFGKIEEGIEAETGNETYYPSSLIFMPGGEKGGEINDLYNR